MPSLIPEDLTQPGTHALVIGVSAYLHFEDGPDPTPVGIEFQMEQLSAAARSASEFAAWLLKDYRCDRAPLKSLRVLLSPSAGEVIHADVAALLNGDFSATRANVRTALAEFRNACNANADNVGIVYIAGHGVQLTKHGAIVLLHDFGDNAFLSKLEGAIDMAGVHGGFNHPNTARTQFWFVDACRQKPAIARRFESLDRAALTLDEPAGTTETSPLFLAAVTGKEAFARVGGVTLFNEALMWGLQGNAGTKTVAGVKNWHISVTALITQLPDRVKVLAGNESVEQSVDIAGKIHEAVFHEFAVPPNVDLKIILSPSEAIGVTRGWLRFKGSVPIVENYSDWPLQQSVGAGLYTIEIQTSDPFKPIFEPLDVRPAEVRAEGDVVEGRIIL
jgi:hypothetical protein